MKTKRVPFSRTSDNVNYKIFEKGIFVKKKTKNKSKETTTKTQLKEYLYGFLSSGWSINIPNW